MKIRPKIPMLQGGSTIGQGVNDWTKYFEWYNTQYDPKAWILGNIPLNKRTDWWKSSKGYDTHHMRDNLESAAWSNYNYTLPENKDTVRSDIQYYADNSGVKYQDGKDFVTKYNTNIDNIYNTQNQHYDYNLNDSSWADFNKNYNLTYNSKGSGANASSIYYDSKNEQYRGTSTHARRPDFYQTKFDDLSDDEKWDRIHKININGTNYYVAKEANGHLRLLDNIDSPEGGVKDSVTTEPVVKTEPEKEKKKNILVANGLEDKESKWSILGKGLKAAAPDIVDALRLGLNLNNNNRIFNTMMKSIKPDLQQTYQTHRQVVGDEATKQAYYRRAVQGETRAAQPFTSDADRQVAYMNEAKRIGDELRAQGDIADNQEIRRTSDESNQHQWGNIQRATEVANHNIIELNQANAAKRQLEAQKYAADTSNWDNWLMGIQNKWEQNKAKQDYINDQINTLQLQDYLEDNPEVTAAYNKLRSLIKQKEADGIINYDKDPEVLAASNALKKARRKAMITGYKLYYSKRGSKLSYTRDDEYLYKTARDVVEHFRKMSKYADQSRQKSKSKPVKLSDHPKSRKYATGGVAPFTIYRPLSLNNSSSSAAYSDSSSSSKASAKNEAAKAKLDMVKELFKELKGLPIDVTLVYNELDSLLNNYKLFGEEMTTDDIASVYTKAMTRLSELQYNQNNFDKAKTLVTQNEGLNEYAVGTDGRMILQDMDTGKVMEGNIRQWLENKDTLNPLTNSQVLDLRSHSSKYAFDNNILSVVENGVGLNKISAQIQSLAANLGQTEKQLEGISEIESGKVKKGLKILADTKGAPNGFYKVTQNEKQSQEQINAALNYIYNMLPKNYRTILELHSDGKGKELIKSFLTSQADYSYVEDVSPLTGKASANDKDSIDKISSNPQLAMIREIGGSPINYSIVTRDSNTKMSVNGTAYPALPNVKEDMSIDAMLSTSGFDSVVLSKAGITFGDQQIDPSNLKDIMYANSGRNAIVTLPCKIVNGVKQVNLAVRDAYEKAESEAAHIADKGSAEYYRVLGKKLKEAHLDSLLDSNGLPNKNMFAQFLIVEGYTSDKVPFENKNSQYIEKVQNPTQDLADRISTALSTDSKKSNYSLDIKDKLALFELTYDDIYRGTVFIPLNNNPNAALSNDKLNVKQSQELEELYQISNKSNNYNKNNSY